MYLSVVLKENEKIYNILHLNYHLGGPYLACSFWVWRAFNSLLPCYINRQRQNEHKGDMPVWWSCLLFVAVHFVPEEGCCYESKLLHLQSVSGPCSYLPVLKFFERAENHIYSPYYFKVHEWSLGFLHAQILVGINLGLRESYLSVVFIWTMMQLGGFGGEYGCLKRTQIMFFKLQMCYCVSCSAVIKLLVNLNHYGWDSTH